MIATETGRDITRDIATIRDAYAQETAARGEIAGWVGFAALRETAGLCRQDFDTAIQAMATSPDVVIIPESNQRAMRPQDRTSAVRVGGQDCHLIQIG